MGESRRPEVGCQLLRRGVRLALWMGLASSLASALDPGRSVTQYGLKSWRLDDGLPHNVIQDAVQTRDGYLWLATLEGLARFDGKRFAVFDSRSVSELRDDNIQALHEDRLGGLWIGTARGLICYRSGKFTSYSVQHGFPNDNVKTIAEDLTGDLWIGTWGGGLSRLRAGKFTCYTTREGLWNDNVWTALCDRSGTVWVGTRGGLCTVRSGVVRRYGQADGIPHPVVVSLYQDHKGAVWIGSHGGLTKYEEGRFTTFTTRQGLSDNIVRAVFEDRDGNLWVGTEGRGLNRLRSGKFDTLTFGDGLSNDKVYCIDEDREGNLWVGTRSGLDRLTDGAVVVYTQRHGLAHNTVKTVFADRTGEIWIGTEGGGLDAYREGRFRHFSKQDGLASDALTALAEDRTGALLIGTRAGFSILRNGRFTSLFTGDGLSHDHIRAIYSEPSGVLWLGTDGGGLNRIQGREIKVISRKDGLANDVVHCLWGDAHNALWIGTRGGLSRLQGDRFTTWTTRQGLSNDAIFAIHGGADGDIWLGTRNGLSRIDQAGRITSYVGAEGLFDYPIYQILDDGLGRLWLASSRGIFALRLTDVEDFDRGNLKALRYDSYDTADGMISSECAGLTQPAACRGRDGSLWFATVFGLARVYPQRSSSNRLPPPVHIAQVLVDNRPLALVDRATLPKGASSLEFHYDASSFVAPDKVRFQRILEGYDHEWSDPESAGYARYTSLPPGPYRFRVAACNNAGVWNREGASLEVYLPPYFYQTIWFRVSAVLGAAFLALLGYRWRVRHHRSREHQLLQLVEDRTQALRDEVEERKKAEEALRTAKDGLELMVQDRTRALLDANLALQEELSERQRAEEALTSSRRRYRDLVRNANDIIFTQDTEGRFTSINPAGERTLGYTSRELLAMRFQDLASPAGAATAVDRLRRNLTGETTPVYELDVVSKDGAAVTLEVNSRPAVRDGSVVGIEGIARDITKRRSLEEQLRQSQKMEAIGKLAGGVAHDFNNMLTVINGYSYMLLRQVPSDAPLFRDLNEIRVAGERAASLTRQLLAFSRKQVLRPDLLDLCAVVSNMDGLLRRLIGEDVEFEVQLGTRPCLVRVDRGQIEQVIMNLAVNARDAMPDGGRLKISTESVQIPPDSIPAGFTGVPGRYALLSVEDGGAGIEESIRNRIFDPFFTTKPQGKGTGLGLSTVYGIVAQSGGCITVESQPGEGSQFRVYLPIVVDDWARAVESEVSRPEPTAGVGTLILVEDDKMVRKMTASILQEAGYTVLEAGDGSEALELARQHEGGIDLVITDMVLPGMNGREVAKRLLRSRPDLKVLYVSGYAEPTVSEKDGMNRDIQFIRKPFLPDVLAAKVRELLGRA